MCTKSKRRMFAGLVFTVTLGFASCASVTMADTAEIDGYTWSYRVLNDGTAEIYKDDGNGFGITAISPSPSDFVAIPEEINGYMVTSVGEGAMQNCYELTGVEIPYNLTNIEAYAFYDCCALEDVLCKAIELRRIGKYAFALCSSLTHLTLPDSLQEIGDCAFQNCTSLKWVYYYGDCPSAKATIYDDTSENFVTFVSADASGWDEALAAGVWQGRSIRAIRSELVDGYTWSYLIHDDNTAEIWNRDYAAVYPRPVGAVTIPSTLGGKPVTRIGKGALESREDMTSVTMPATVTSIGDSAFIYCSSLKSVKMPAGLKSIEDKAFCGVALENVTIPNGVTNIGERAFSGCGYLKSVTISAGATHIGHHAFIYCTLLTDLYLYADPNALTWVMDGCAEQGYNVDMGRDTKIHVKADQLRQYQAFFGVNLADATLVGDLGIVYVTVTFDANGGKGGTKRPIASGAALGTLPSATRNGYTLKGWYTAKSGGSKVSSSTKVTKNVTYYAQWTANKHKITFDPNGGKGGTSRTVANGASLGTLPDATRKGYTLKGWYTAKSGGSKLAASTKVTKAVTYYAQWTANKYKIKFHKNGGTGTMKALSATYDKNVSLRANAFKRTGYKFAGWAKTKTGKVAYKNKAKVKNLTTVNDRVVTLYAVWKRAK